MRLSQSAFFFLSSISLVSLVCLLFPVDPPFRWDQTELQPHKSTGDKNSVEEFEFSQSEPVAAGSDGSSVVSKAQLPLRRAE